MLYSKEKQQGTVALQWAESNRGLLLYNGQQATEDCCSTLGLWRVGNDEIDGAICDISATIVAKRVAHAHNLSGPLDDFGRTVPLTQGVVVNVSIAYASTWEERLFDLGNIPPSRVLTDPPPGTASIEDVIRLRERDRRLVELVDRTLVEKAMGWRESFLASIISFWLNRYLENHRLGVVTGADGLTRLFGDTVRGPDVSFVAWDRLPNGKIPSTPVPSIVPNLVVEVLSIGNTYGEMSRKRREYFQAGVQLVWMVDPHDRSVTVFTGPDDWTIARDGETIDAGTVLPGFSIHTGDLFAKLDEQESQGRK